MLVDLTPFDITGKDMERMLDEVHITVNKNTIPKEQRSPFVTSGIRIGTPASTSRGMVEEDMVEIGKLIKLTATDFETKKDEIIARVAAICNKYPLYR